MTAAQYRATLAAGQAGKKNPANKYSAVKTRYESHLNGVRLYDSKKEAQRAMELDLSHKAGEILGWLPQQPKFPLPGGHSYTADFLILLRDGSVRVEDTKGFDTKESNLKRALVSERYKLNIEVI
jgi:restriction endonuclease